MTTPMVCSFSEKSDLFKWGNRPIQMGQMIYSNILVELIPIPRQIIVDRQCTVLAVDAQNDKTAALITNAAVDQSI